MLVATASTMGSPIGYAEMGRLWHARGLAACPNGTLFQAAIGPDEIPWGSRREAHSENVRSAQNCSKA